jgi:cytochrome c oxidase subunit 2
MYRLMALTALVAVGGSVALARLQSERRIVRVSAERFSFAPSEIPVAVGEEIEIRLRSDDTAHGFHILGTETNITIPKRGQGETSVVVRFDRPGRYTFECSRMCGAGHNFMRGELVVRERPAGSGGR